MWSTQYMTGKLKWERIILDVKPKRSLKDEAEFMTHDLASRSLAKAESRQLEKKRQAVSRSIAKASRKRNRKKGGTLID